MRHLPLVAGGVLAVFVSTSAVAQSFIETLVAVYNNSPALQAQRAALRATDEGVPQALSNWRPSLSFSSEYGYREQTTSGRSSSSSDGVLHPFTNSLTLSQPLYRGGRTVAATQSAEASVLAGRAVLTSAEQNVLFQGVTAYMDVVRDQAVVELNRNNEQRLRRQLEATRDRFRVGEITRTDVAQAEARLSRAISDRVTSEGNLASSRAGFRRVVGETPRQLVAPPPLPSLPRSEDEAHGVAEEENPELSSAQHRENAARYDIRATSGSLLPTVSLNASKSRAEESSRDTTTDTTRVLMQFTLPLYESGITYSQVRQRRQIHQQRRLEVDDSRRQVREGVTRAWEALTTARASIVARRAEVAANRVALDGVMQEAEVGARTTLDVLDAEQELLDSQVALVRAQRDEYVAGFQLQSAIGRLSARRLGLPVDAYDPTDNYQRVRDKWIGLDNGLD